MTYRVDAIGLHIFHVLGELNKAGAAMSFQLRNEPLSSPMRIMKSAVACTP
jgi:hypothetical protein